jgi:hypothetical protein
MGRSKQRKGDRRQQAVPKPRTHPHLFHHLTPTRLRCRSRATLSLRSQKRAHARVAALPRRFGAGAFGVWVTVKTIPAPRAANGGRGHAVIVTRPTRCGRPHTGAISGSRRWAAAGTVDPTR